MDISLLNFRLQKYKYFYYLQIVCREIFNNNNIEVFSLNLKRI